MDLKAEQMFVMGSMGLDFIGWQHTKSGPSFICVNDTKQNNATYTFASDASGKEIYTHTMEMRNRFKKSRSQKPEVRIEQEQKA